MNPVELINGLSEKWAVFMLDRTLGSTLVFVFVGLIWVVLRRRISPQWGYLLFLLVLVKLIIPYQPYSLSQVQTAPTASTPSPVSRKQNRSLLGMVLRGSRSLLRWGQENIILGADSAAGNYISSKRLALR